MLRGVRASASVFGQRDTAQSLLEVPRVLFVLLDFLFFFGKVTLKEKKISLQSENEIQSWFSDEKRQKHW